MDGSAWGVDMVEVRFRGSTDDQGAEGGRVSEDEGC